MKKFWKIVLILVVLFVAWEIFDISMHSYAKSDVPRTEEPNILKKFARWYVKVTYYKKD